MKRLQYNSPVILTYALVSFAVLMISRLTGGASDTLLFSVYRSPFTDIFMYPRLLGHALGHAGMEHYFGNFVLILIVGPMLEEKYGSKALIQMILVTALITGVLFMAVSKPGFAMFGASGVAFMLMLLGSFANIKKGRIPLTLILALIVFVGREIVSGVTADDNIAHMAHIAGGICGAAFGFIFNKEKGFPVNV
jgi:membrane associated rhomboid family serine protease